ncbi:MAG: cation-translocating P-type ATPase C-terminal domain-containing protein [Anaerolineae bacterium]|nr:cation-translocating P-type ATPase C-terminal domain-containing protein [Anaerolineae bacterium]
MKRQMGFGWTGLPVLLAAIYLPALQWVFRMEPITLTEWLRILLISVTVVVVEIDKLVRRVIHGSR